MAWDSPSGRLAVVLAPTSNDLAPTTTLSPSGSQTIPTADGIWRLCVLVPVSEGTHWWHPTRPLPLPPSLKVDAPASNKCKETSAGGSEYAAEEPSSSANDDQTSAHFAPPPVTLDWAWTGELLVSAAEGRCALFTMSTMSEYGVHLSSADQLADREATAVAASLVWQSHYDTYLAEHPCEGGGVKESCSSDSDDKNRGIHDARRIYAPGVKSAAAILSTGELLDNPALAGDNEKASEGATTAAGAIPTAMNLPIVVSALSNDGALIVARDPNDDTVLCVWQRTELDSSEPEAGSGGCSNSNNGIKSHPWTWTQVCVIVHPKPVRSARWRPSPPGVRQNESKWV